MSRLSKPLVQASLAFCAGALASLLFLQGTWGIAHAVSATLPKAYPLPGVPRLGTPQVLAASVWGGGWAMVLGHLLRRLSPGPVYWLVWALVGAVVPLAGGWLLGVARAGALPLTAVAPLLVAWALVANGAWGVGTAGFLRLFGVQRG
jgi:hypothetical protein